MPRPVAVCCADETLAAAVQRIAAGAGADPTPMRVDEVVAGWLTSPMVVADLTRAEDLAALRLPPRSGVLVVVETGRADDGWAVAASLGATAVVGLPGGDEVLADILGGLRPRGTAAAASVIAVTGAVGGCGTSTVAVGVAAAASALVGSSVVVDLDVAGGGLDLAVGLEGAEGPRWSDIVAADGAGRLPDAVGRLPVAGRVGVLSADRSGTAAVPDTAFLVRLLRQLAGRYDVVVLDVPRSVAAAAPTLLAAAGQILLVCGRQVRAAAAAAVVSRRLDATASTVRLVAAGPAEAEISAADLAAAAGLPLAGVVPVDRRIPRASAVGTLHRLPRRSPAARQLSHLAEAILDRDHS